jgi:hypothetical protein
MAKGKDSCAHDRLAIQLMCPDCGDEIEQREITRAEMEAHAVQLPEREAMSLVNANVAAPINLALAANVLSDNSVAIASAQQYAPINQGM